jgi:hypothetical protein
MKKTILPLKIKKNIFEPNDRRATDGAGAPVATVQTGPVPGSKPMASAIGDLLAQIEKLKVQVQALTTATKSVTTKGDLPADHPAEQFAPGTPAFQELLNAAVAAATAKQPRQRSAEYRLTSPDMGTAQVPVGYTRPELLSDPIARMLLARDSYLARTAGVARALQGMLTYSTSDNRTPRRIPASSTLKATSGAVLQKAEPQSAKKTAAPVAPARRRPGFRV